MPYRPPQCSVQDLFRSDPSGVLTELQVEAFLWGYFAACTRTRDRRIGGATIRANPVTGMPESVADLAPSHRAVFGPELALKQIVPPEDFAAMHVQTDDLPEYVGVPVDQRKPVYLSYKPKPWSEEEVLAVKENARRIKRVVHRLAAEGLFVTKPRLDDCKAELGTDELALGEDGYTMGFSLTPEGLAVAEAFAADHPELLNRQHVLDGLGPFAEKAQEWLKAEYRIKATTVG